MRYYLKGDQLSHFIVEDKDIGKIFFAKPLPDILREIVEVGGVVEYIKKKGLTDKNLSAL